MRTNLQKLACLTLGAAVTGWTHFTWVAPVNELQAGKTAKIMVAHGDRFPQSEEAVNAAQLKLFVLAPSGARTDLKPASAGTSVTADFAVKESGTHRIVFVQDRGAMSRTPKGVKSGGRDRNPDATEAFTMLRTGVWQGAARNHKPLGLDAELTAELDGASGAWQVQLLRGGKPLAGQKVQVVLNGQKDEIAIGSTGADGKVAYRPSAGSRGPAMFLSEFSEKAPGGSPIDERRFSTTLYVNW